MTNRQLTVSDILYDGSFRLSPKKRDKYRKYFKSTKKKYEHFLTGAEVAVIVKDKGLSMKDLFQVWKFADGDEDGRLSIDEFCLAMAMIDILKERREMPGFNVLKKSGLRVTIKKGNIEKDESDMIVCSFGERVNFARGHLAASIYLAGGIELQKSFDRKYPDGIKVWQVVALPAEGELKCTHVIVGRIPVYENSEDLDAVHEFIRGCLQLANDYGAKSVAFPLFGTGGLEYSKGYAAEALYEVLENFPNRTSLTDVCLVAHPLDRASLFALRAAEQRHLYSYGVEDNARNKAAETIQWNGQYASTISCLSHMSEERRKEYEKNFAKYAIKNHADSRYSITGKRLSSILLQTGVDVYTVQQIMTIINKSDESQVLVEDFLAASALIDRATEGYRLPDISRLYLIRDELFKNIQYKQHIFDPRYCLSWFYHRDMKFETANGILKMPGRRDGSFLVWRRKNDDFYSLGTIFGHGSFHLRIDITAGMYSVERNVKFPQLGRLIQHYMAHPLPIPGDRRLKYPIPVHTPSTKRWFYPNISPVSAILLLRIFSSEQNFIVRYSVETPGCFALVLSAYV
ncbi:uncharacterized protein LOC117343340 [Pecten maximus]|uniref:uncharacterized protein LOC117343340 n=1 Tax=Pecten maximus TaxID=6579 RepID=UPI0014584B3C|nr:uncharacterized protein LOC117343340 [Pecten maximus]